MSAEYNEEAKARLMAKVTKNEHTDCWNFGGALASKGNGEHRFLHYRHGGLKETRAHRVAYLLFIGPIPDGQLIRHKCDNASCVNPAHLEPGTHQDNMSDKALRGPNKSATGIKGVYECNTGYLAKVKHRGQLAQKFFKRTEDAAAWVGEQRQRLHGLIPTAPLVSSVQLALF